MASPRTIARLEARVLERAAHCVEFEINDPRSAFITVTRVELATDLSTGKIFYSVLGGVGEKSKAAHMLEAAAGFIQRQVARVLKVRRMPHLRWIYDDSIEYAARMDEAISEALHRDEEIRETGAPEEGPPEDWEQEYEAFTDEDPKGT